MHTKLFYTGNIQVKTEYQRKNGISMLFITNNQYFIDKQHTILTVDVNNAK